MITLKVTLKETIKKIKGTHVPSLKGLTLFFYTLHLFQLLRLQCESILKILCYLLNNIIVNGCPYWIVWHVCQR